MAGIEARRGATEIALTWLPEVVKVAIVEPAGAPEGKLKLPPPAEVPPAKKPKNHRYRLPSVSQKASFIRSP